LPRVSRDQARMGTEVSSLAEAKPGDLIAFGTPTVDHIAIYAVAHFKRCPGYWRKRQS